MRVYKKKTIRRMKWYGVILVLSGIPLGIGMGRSLEEGRTFLLEESQTYAQKLYLPLFSYQKEQAGNSGKCCRTAGFWNGSFY